MSGPEDVKTPHAAATPPPSPPRRGLRRLAIAVGIVAAVVALLAALLLGAPRYVARWIADRYLTGMQIDVEGVKTIDIDLPKGELSFGPVRFHSGTAEPGTIGLLGVEFSLRNLLDKQALLERVLLKDLAVTIRQTPERQLLINGISLRQILAQEAREDTRTQASAASSWGAGVDDLGIRNAQITFVNPEGGTARLTVAHLDVRAFRTWEPDQPGTFVLAGDVNGVDVHAYGTAQPFAEKVTAQAEIGIDGIDLRSIEEYTGPLDLKPTTGTLTVYARTAFTLFPEGRLEGTADTTLVLANIDTARVGTGEIRMDQASLTADGQFVLGEAGDLSFTGKGEAKLNRTDGRLAGGTTLQVASATLTLSDLALSLPGDGALRLSAHPQLDMDAPAVGGPVEARSRRLVLDLPRLDVARGADGKTTLTTVETGTITATDGSVALAAGEGTTPLAIDFASLTTRASKLVVDRDAERTRLTGEVGAQAQMLTVAVPPSPAGRGPGVEAQRFTADSFDLALPSLKMETAARGLTIAMTGDARLGKFAALLPAAADQPRIDVAADGTRLGFDDVTVASGGADADTRVGGRMSVELAKIAGSWSEPAARAPAAAARGRPVAAAAQAGGGSGRFAADSLRLQGAPLKLQSAGERTTIAGGGSVEIANLQANVPQPGDAAPWDIALSRLRLAVAGLDASAAAAQAALTGRLEATTGGFVATQPAKPTARPRAGDRTRIALDSLQVSLPSLELRSIRERLSLRGAGSAQLTALALELPRTDQKPAATATIAAVRTELQELAFEQAGGRPSWNARMNVLADRLASDTEGGALASVKLQAVTIGDLRANDRRQLGVDRVVLDRLQAFLTREYIFASATKEKSRPKEAVEAVQEAVQEGWRLRIDSTSVTGGASFRLRDTAVNPPANATIDIQSLQVLNLNTGDPAQRTQIRLDATINQFTELAFAGWAEPFRGQPDFDLNARLRRLELPALSPYAAQAIGLNVESGRLGLDVSATASAGNLNGLLDLTLRDLDFSALSAADAQRLSASVGVPIHTIVGLLQDDQGRIRLSLPISGNLANPSFDPSDAIRQALTGALQAAVLAPFQLAFAPVALIARAAGGGPGDGLGLQPIPFPAGVATLDSTARDMTQGLARVLQERDRLTLKVCGRATAQDLEAALRDDGAPTSGPGRAAAIEQLAPELWSLAGERTANVRTALITDGGAKPRQVGECRILYDPTDTGPPRAEVGL